LEFRKGISKKEAQSYADRILNEPGFALSLVKMLKTEGTTNMKASWILSTAAELHPGVLNAFVEEYITLLPTIKTMGTKRELIKGIWLSDFIHAENLGLLSDTLLEFIRSNQQDVSVRYNAMKVMVEICKTYPELKEEFHETIRTILPYISPTFRNFAKKFVLGK
jgi:hypothetical protein